VGKIGHEKASFSYFLSKNLVIFSDSANKPIKKYQKKFKGGRFFKKIYTPALEIVVQPAIPGSIPSLDSLNQTNLLLMFLGFYFCEMVDTVLRWSLHCLSASFTTFTFLS